MAAAGDGSGGRRRREPADAALRLLRERVAERVVTRDAVPHADGAVCVDRESVGAYALGRSSIPGGGLFSSLHLRPDARPDDSRAGQAIG